MFAARAHSPQLAWFPSRHPVLHIRLISNQISKTSRRNQGDIIVRKNMLMPTQVNLIGIIDSGLRRVHY